MQAKLLFAAIGLIACVSASACQVPGITAPIPGLSPEQKSMACANYQNELKNPPKYSGAHADARKMLKDLNCPDVQP